MMRCSYSCSNVTSFMLQIRSSLQEAFSSCGEITRVSIPKDYETGASKGFVQFLLLIF